MSWAAHLEEEKPQTQFINEWLLWRLLWRLELGLGHGDTRGSPAHTQSSPVCSQGSTAHVLISNCICKRPGCHVTWETLDRLSWLAEEHGDDQKQTTQMFKLQTDKWMVPKQSGKRRRSWPSRNQEIKRSISGASCRHGNRERGVWWGDEFSTRIQSLRGQN